MDFHLDSLLRLKTETDYKGLYTWAINEHDAEGGQIGLDQIPWEWTFYFTATSCVLSDDLDVTQPLNFKFTVRHEDGTAVEHESAPGKGPTIGQSEGINLQLRSGAARNDKDEEYFHETAFSMFGTNRVIKKIELNIHPLSDPAAQEKCTVWGCVSYTSEIDFRYETTDDCLIFYLWVKPDTFARYVSRFSNGLVDEVVFSVGQVDGFYSDWSPEISTDNVKVLTASDDQKIEVPPDCPIKPPRLGTAREFKLHVYRRLAFRRRTPDPDVGEQSEPDDETHQITAPTAPPANVQMPADPAILAILRSIKRAAWFVVSFLALLLIVMLSRH